MPPYMQIMKETCLISGCNVLHTYFPALLIIHPQIVNLHSLWLSKSVEQHVSYSPVHIRVVVQNSSLKATRCKYHGL